MSASASASLAAREREEDVAVELAHLLRGGGARRVVVLHLAGDLHREVARVERLDLGDPAPPPVRPAQVVGRSLPSGVTAPRPVIATRLIGLLDAPGAQPVSRFAPGRIGHVAETKTEPDPPKSLPYPPMEAQLVDELPEGDGWQYEPKWDGFRGILENLDGEVHLWSRNGRPLLRYFPELVELGERLPKRSALDGEIVIEREGGLDFDALQMRLHPAESRVRKLSAEIPAGFVVFDVLLWDGKDLHGKPIEERRKTVREAAVRHLARRRATAPRPSTGSTGSRWPASTASSPSGSAALHARARGRPS